MVACRCLSGVSKYFFVVEEVFVVSDVAFFIGNYLFCNIFYEVKLHPRHALQALQPTSKPGRPHINYSPKHALIIKTVLISEP
jgi:hypothetical protein